MPSAGVATVRNLSTGHWLAALAELNEKAVAIDIIDFRVTIPVSTTITQPTAERIRDDFRYLLTEVRASATIATDLDDFDSIRFNIRRSDTKDNLFSTDLELSGLVGAQNGRVTPVKFDDGGMLIAPGTTLAPTFTRRDDITTARVVVVYLVFQLVPLA